MKPANEREWAIYQAGVNRGRDAGMAFGFGMLGIAAFIFAGLFLLYVVLEKSGGQ